MSTRERTDHAEAGERRRVTSFDVAERAGVSQSTVSRALAGLETITAATRRRVEEAARELGYFVDSRAARFRSGDTRTIAVVVITREGGDVRAINPFHFTLLGSTCAAAAARGFEALVTFQSEPEQLFGRFVEERRADAVIVIGTTANLPAWEHFRNLAEDQPNMAFWGVGGEENEWVRSDNFQGAQLAVERLVAAGHRRIAFVGETAGHQPQFGERYEGYCRAMTAQGLAPLPAVTGTGDTRDGQGRAAMEAILEGDRPDGLFFACDAMALGALDHLARNGVDVPGDIGVVGFDGLGSGAHSHPPLTTVEPEFALAGEMLVSVALEAGSSERRVPVRLVERRSVRAPR